MNVRFRVFGTLVSGSCHACAVWCATLLSGVVVQGVGDIYTDPQIHTLDGKGFGSGNLGLRGMAMFFRTHECNDLCRQLGLHEFERCGALPPWRRAQPAARSHAVSGPVCRTSVCRTSTRLGHDALDNRNFVLNT